MPDRNASKGLPALAVELKDLVVAYAKQETVEPMKGLARFVALGLGGSIMWAIGLVLLVLAALRALQTELPDQFDGNWSAAPYGIVFVGCIVVAAASGRAIGAARRRSAASKSGR